MRSEFLQFKDVVLPAPLPALLSVLMATGLATLGWRLARRLRGGPVEALDAAAGFVTVTAAAAVLVHGLALAQLSTVALVRPLGWALAAVGGFALVRHGAALIAAARAELADLKGAPRWEKGIALLIVALLVGLGAAALGPATDADSIHYHLAVPLDWLRHGGAYPRPDWSTSRLIGVGESLNLLGLAAGTDGLGAALQLGGLVSAAAAAAALATTSRDRRLAWLLVIGTPVAAYLVPNQKPMMLPAAATAVAIVLAVRRFERFGRVDALLAFTCGAFALSCKLSFILSGGFALLVALLAARKSGTLAATVGIGAAAIAVIWAPLLARSFFFFGDPISPLLERLRPHPDPQVLSFAEYLHDANGEHTLGNLLRLPLAMLGTVQLSGLTTPLGLGVLAFVPALAVKGRHRVLLWAALAAAVTCVVLGQIAPRFFLEAFLWAGATLAVAPWNRAKKLVAGGIVLQGCVSSGIALFGAALVFPGALTPHLRDAVLTRSAPGYPEGKWLDALLPRDAIIVEPTGRFQLYTPRPFLMTDPAMVDEPARGDALLRHLIEPAGVTHVVDDGSSPIRPFRRLEKRCGVQLGPTREFPLAARNPFIKVPYAAQVFELRDCWPRQR
jgi:hypothetical protein